MKMVFNKETIGIFFFMEVPMVFFCSPFTLSEFSLDKECCKKIKKAPIAVGAKP